MQKRCSEILNKNHVKISKNDPKMEQKSLKNGRKIDGKTYVVIFGAKNLKNDVQGDPR